MGKRRDLHDIFCSLLGARNVYFQPPDSVNMRYPCIMYERGSDNTKYANNAAYMRMIQYRVTVVDKDPDSDISEKVAGLPLCSFERHFISGNLNHDVYNLFY